MSSGNGAPPRGAGRWLALLAVLGTALALLPAGASADELSAVRARREQLQARLDEAAEALAELEARSAQLDDDRRQLAEQLTELEAEVASAEGRIAARIRNIYKRGRVDPVMLLVADEAPEEALGRAAVMASLVRGDRAVAETAEARRTEASVVAERLAERTEALDAALGEYRARQESLREDLEEAARLERRREQEKREREQAARRAAAARARAEAEGRAAPGGGGYVCPVGRPRSFTNTWGAPRSGGRSHRGTDVLAPYGTNVYAVTSGVVERHGYGRSAGYWLVLQGSDGNHYWYLHLQSFAVGDGARVSAGRLIAYNGDTGNARGTPHVHFELHPGGGGAINPYHFLRRACG
ncbi:MAG: murein hydrolase activator EnvC family protein [Nitriliruptorales bacterium]